MPKLQDWKLAKKKFEKLTGKSKPVDKVMGQFRQSSGIEKALKACDKAEAAMKANPSEEAEEKLVSDVRSLTKASGRYLTQLQTAINAAKGELDDDFRIYLKGLKFLKTTLESYRGHFQALTSGSPQNTEDKYPSEIKLLKRQSGLKAVVGRGRAASAQVKLRLAGILKSRQEQGDGPEDQGGDSVEDLRPHIEECQATIEAMKPLLRKLIHAINAKGFYEGPGFRDLEEYIEETESVTLELSGGYAGPNAIPEIADYTKRFNIFLKMIQHDFEL